MDKKVKKAIKIVVCLLAATFVILTIIAKRTKKDTIYDNAPEEKNPMEGKKVIFVESEDDEENADGVKGHLEAVGDSDYHPGFYEKYVKRLVDILLSFAGLVILSPVFAVIALAIKIEDPGPVLFTQKRLGRNKQYFKLHKFRSMKVSTPHDVPTHMLENPEQYITKVGVFLRRHSLDELPQIWDIFVGNLAVVGPRPGLWNQDRLTAEREKYGANDVKPGLTGWAQINGRDELEIPDKAKLDGEYLQRESFWFDVKCFLSTVRKVARDDSVVEGGTGKMKKKSFNSHQPRVLLVANVAKEHVLKFHIPTIKSLKDDGWYVDVACSGDEKIPYCDHQYHMSYKRSPFTYSTLKGVMELKKIINKGCYDIIYCHTPVGGFAARLASIKARKRGTKVVYFAHGYHFYKHAPIQNWLLYYPIEKLLSMITDSIILINNEDYELTKRKFKTCRAYKIDGIGVDMTRFNIDDREGVRKDYRRQFGIPQDATVLIYLAELFPNKNQTFLMNVLKKVHEKEKNVYLILAGVDHTAGKFEKYAESIGGKKYIKFLGWREDVGNLYATADICTATSIREGFGLNLVEAMACGLPVVATNNRGHETIIRDGENGFLVTIGDIDTFANRILLLIHDKCLRKKFVRVCNDEKSKYSSEVAVANIKSILSENL